MKPKIFAIFVLLLTGDPLPAGLLINEVVCGSSSDWVELYMGGGGREEMEISSLYVTMYYGTNERLGTEPIYIYSYDRPETPWDDRFVVVHPASIGIPDETESTGDANGNGVHDLYCNSYFGSYWNTDCVVAVDSDDDPANGGIIDFIAFSNRDGSVNKTVESYILDAAKAGEWQVLPGNIQLSCIDIGLGGLSPLMSISRLSDTDTNAPADFTLSSFQTQGRPNILHVVGRSDRLMNVLHKRINVVPGMGKFGDIPIFVYQQCTLKLRVFSSVGHMVYDSPAAETANPGYFTLKWDQSACRSLRTGLYIGKLEATSTSLGLSEERIVYFLVSR